MVNFFARLGDLDRRWIFLVIGLSVIIPILVGFGAPMPTSPIVQAIYDKVESLPEGSLVLLSFDYGPGTEPENQPMAEGLLRHCMERDLKVVMMALWATGPPQVNMAIENVYAGPRATHPDKVYGEDWINIGFKAGNQGVINSILRDISFFPTDAREGAPLSTFPITRSVKNLTDFDMILCIGSGKPGLKEWVQFAGDQGDIPVGGGVTAVEAPLLYPYYPNQLVGLMGGMQGAAEYETALLSGYPHLATHEPSFIAAASSKMGPQTVAHIMIVLFVLIGNLSLLARRSREARGG